MIKSIKTLKKRYKNNYDNIENLNGLKSTFEDHTQQISDYQNLTNNMQEIPTEMVSSTRKDGFKRELEEIIKQFKAILAEIDERTSELLRSSEELQIIDRKLNSLENELNKLEGLFESVVNTQLSCENCSDKFKTLSNLNQNRLEKVVKELKIIKLQLSETYDNLDSSSQSKKRDELFDKYTRILNKSSREELVIEKISVKIEEIRANYRHLKDQVVKLKDGFDKTGYNSNSKFWEMDNPLETIRNLQSMSKQLSKLNSALDLNRRSLQNVVQENNIECYSLLKVRSFLLRYRMWS